ncbi:MAG: quinolinate synthase NadA [Candidatus Firestonebacteria bacterium]
MSKNAKLIADIMKIKKERKAVLLVHNYQLPELQDIADLTGDSLGLSLEAAKTGAETIVFCGVKFMAETASIICPEKKVLLPDITSGCPMADMITAAQLLELKKKHPGAAVVAYVNSSAEVKAESDYCCTSANSAEIVNSVTEEKIIFIPDKYLGAYTARMTGRELILWEGYCPTHAKIMPQDILKRRKEYPLGKVMAHPECTQEVCELADIVCSTEGFVRFAGKTEAKDIIVATEAGMLHRLKKEAPGKNFIPASELAVCPNMKKNTLEKVLWALEEMKYEIKVPEGVRVKALRAINRMLGKK